MLNAQIRIAEPPAGVTLSADQPIVGSWTAIGAIGYGTEEDYDPQNPPTGPELWLVGANFLLGGGASVLFADGAVNPSFIAWEDEWITWLGDDRRAPYKIREIEGVEYLFFPWGGSAEAAPARYFVLVRVGVDAPALHDRDGDGVVDNQDMCPDWPGDASMSGC